MTYHERKFLMDRRYPPRQVWNCECNFVVCIVLWVFQINFCFLLPNKCCTQEDPLKNQKLNRRKNILKILYHSLSMFRHKRLNPCSKISTLFLELVFVLLFQIWWHSCCLCSLDISSKIHYLNNDFNLIYNLCINPSPS